MPLVRKTTRILAAIVALWTGWVTVAVADFPPLERHYQAAQAALVRGDTAKAKRELKLSLQDNPIHVESHLLLASLLGREGDLDQAMVGFQRTVALEPNNAVARYNLGTALLWRGEPVLAARQLEATVVIRPDHVPSYNNLAKAYFLAGLPELAAASYNEALRRDPSNAVAFKGLAALTQAGRGQKPSGSGETDKPAVDGGQPSSRLTPDPPPPVIEGHEQAPVAAEVLDGATAPHEAGERAEFDALRELVSDLPHVTVDWRGGQLALAGWTSGVDERKLLDRILAIRKDVLDSTGDDTGDPHRLIEVDATIFKVIGIDSESAGHNFLRRIEVNASLADGAMTAFNWMYSAAISYDVNIANALEERIALLARPHLTTLSGTPATFIAGGDIVYKVSGTTSGDIKPYPFGTTLDVTPTLMRTRDENDGPRIRLVVKAGRRTLLPIADIAGAEEGSTVFENIQVTSEAVLDINQTLILTGLSQRESRTVKSGVPGLKSIPIIKYLFSSTSTTTSDLAIIILLTPRDPAYWDEQNQKATAEFVERRRAYVQASQGTEEDLRRFKEQYPDWDKLAPNRFASHFFLMETSDTYRRVSGIDLASEDLDYDLLGKPLKQKGKK